MKSTVSVKKGGGYDIMTIENSINDNQLTIAIDVLAINEHIFFHLFYSCSRVKMNVSP